MSIIHGNQETTYTLTSLTKAVRKIQYREILCKFNMQDIFIPTWGRVLLWVDKIWHDFKTVFLAINGKTLGDVILWLIASLCQLLQRYINYYICHILLYENEVEDQPKSYTIKTTSKLFRPLFLPLLSLSYSSFLYYFFLQ